MKHFLLSEMIIVLVLLGIRAERPDPENPAGLIFSRKSEPNEQAFSILVPREWQIKGGIFRVNPSAVGGPLNSVEAKCDLQLVSDERGSIGFHILPDIVYAHPGAGGVFSRQVVFIRVLKFGHGLTLKPWFFNCLHRCIRKSPDTR
ncbi:MAG: hypothetical protein JXQ65_14295 [Candidatus Marinimicrobia bacterium]|nr:hypothetical protein [Candidatus Neomarinimicrobiota bacterium]